MLKEQKIFRIKRNGEWSFKLTRHELLRELEKSAITRSWNWPYSIKYGEERNVKNICGKVLLVRKEYSYGEEHKMKKGGQKLPYSLPS